MARRTNAQFMDYLEQCATEGAVYGGKFFHCSADDRIRWNRIIGRNTSAIQTETLMRSSAACLVEIAEWRAKTIATIASKLRAASLSKEPTP